MGKEKNVRGAAPEINPVCHPAGDSATVTGRGAEVSIADNESGRPELNPVSTAPADDETADVPGPADGKANAFPQAAVVEQSDPGEEDDEAQDELYEHFNLTVDRGQAMLRIDKFLTNRLESTSRNRIQAAADSGNIIVNGRPVKASYKVKPLDVVSIVLPYPRRQLEIIPENIPLDIVFEDDHLMVINKPAGMVVHPGHGNYSGTLVNALTYHLQGLELFSEGDMRAGLVHRIDKDTSGLLVIAKNEKVHARLARQFFDHTIERHYWALAWGNLPEEEGTITGHIGRSVRDRLKMFVYADGEAGKHAVTHYKVLKRYGYVTLVECRLETGRTHQIRVHMEWQGHPLFNDSRYGGDHILKGTTFSKYKQFIQNCFSIMPRQALHAKSLGFEHPVTRQRLHFDSPLAPDFQQVLDKWDNYVTHRDTFEEDEVQENLSAVM
ncbi:MAG: RluA family pseudouridine synthase [Alistipes sp.]|nr:RluA family pseudouridine synthase [Alistipes sp.]